MRTVLGAAFALMLTLTLTPIAEAGFYAQHDDIGDALEDILDGYGRPNDCPEDEEDENGECPEEDNGGDGDDATSGETDGDDTTSGDSSDDFSWIDWIVMLLTTTR